MTHYLVRWEVDIEADSPSEAALAARVMQLRPDSIATVFDVCDDRGHFTRVDLEEL